MHWQIVLAASCAVAALHHCLAARSGRPSDARETALAGAGALALMGWWLSAPALARMIFERLAA